MLLAILLFLSWTFSQKKKFFKWFFYNKTFDKSWLMKVDTEAKFQGLQLLQNELFRFAI